MGFKTDTLTAVDASISGNLYASALTQAQTAYLVYYNPTSKQLTYDVSTGAGGGGGSIGGTIAADQIAYGTSADTIGGSTNFVIDNLGKVGIGTDTPSFTLDVIGDLRSTVSSHSTRFFNDSPGSATTPVSTSGWYRIASIDRGGGTIILSYTGGSWTPTTYVIHVYKDWGTNISIDLENYGHATYITGVRVVQDTNFYIEINMSSHASGHSFAVYQNDLLGYSSGITVNTGALTAGTGTVYLQRNFVHEGRTTGRIQSVALDPNEWVFEARDSSDLYSSGIYLNNNQGNLYLRDNAGITNVRIDSGGKSYLNGGNVGIGTNNPTANLHIASTGNAILLLEADTDNVSETDQPRVEFSQDAGGVTGMVGYTSGNNDIYLNNIFNSALRLRTTNTDRLIIEGGGDISIPGGDLTTTGAISYTGTSYVHVLAPEGAYIDTNTNPGTGAIKIVLPALKSNTMITMEVDIFDYAGGSDGEAIKMQISGYPNSSGWANVTSAVISGRTDRFYTVRFGDDGTKSCIWIGETTSTWNYLKIGVSNFKGWHSNATEDIWADGWSIVPYQTSFGTVNQTRTSELIASYALNADKLDNISSASFLRSDTSDTFTGTLTVNGTLAATTVTGANVTTGSNPGHTHTTASITNLSGTNTGDQTTITGNAGSATILQTTRTINGVSFNGSANITVEPYISGDDTGDTNNPIVFTANSTAGFKRLYEDSALYFDNTNNRLYSTWFYGSLSGNATSATNANTLDGLDSTAFLRSNAADSATSLITFDAGLKLNDSDRALFGSSSDYEIYFTGAHLYIDDNGVTAGSDIKFTTAATARFTFDMDTYKGTAVDWIASSDARLKENIVSYDNVLDKISTIKGSLVHFDWIDSGNKDVGAIAQELKPHFPEFVIESDAEDNLVENQLSISYGKLSMVALEGIAELRDEKSIEILELKEKNKILESRLDILEDKLNILINK